MGIPASVPPEPLSIDVDDSAADVRVTLRGDADVYSAADLRRRLNEVIDAGEVALVVDLSHLAFLDTSGLGVLVGATQRARRNGGSLALVLGGNDSVRMVFEITGLDKVLDVR